MGAVGRTLSAIGSIALMAVPGLGLFGVAAKALRTLTLIGTGISIAGGIISRVTAPRRTAEPQQAAGHLATVRSLDATIPLVYGEMRVGGNIVFAATTGANNEHMHMVVTIAEGPIDSVVWTWLDDRISSLVPPGGGGAVEIATGTPGQPVMTSLANAVPGWADALRHTAYAYIRLTYHADIWQSLPLPTFLVRGLRILDVRSGATVWTRNPALVAYDLMTSGRYGMGLPVDVMDIQSFRDAANWCDTEGLQYNGIIRDPATAQDTLNSVMLSMRGYLSCDDGIYRLRVYRHESPVMTLTEDHILQGSASVEMPGLPETPNRVIAHWIDPEQQYTQAQLTLATQATISADGRDRDMEITLSGVTSYWQAARLAAYYLVRARRNRIYSFAATSQAYPLEVGDVIAVTHSQYGWTARTVRIVEIVRHPEHTVALRAVEEDADLYNFVLDVPIHDTAMTTLPRADAVPPDAGAVTLTETASISILDRTITRLNIGFAAPVWPWWDYAEIHISINGGPWTHRADTIASTWIEPVDVGAEYRVRVRGVSVHGVRRPLDDCTIWTRMISGAAVSVGAITGLVATASSDSITISWAALPGLDVPSYEIRIGETWATALMIGRWPSSRVFLSGLRPGNYRLWVAGVAMDGTHGTPSSVDVTVLWPAGYTQINAWTDNFAGGTHSGTSWLDHGTHGRVLRATHATNPGTYLSPSYDIGSLRNVRTWLDHLLVHETQSTLWSSIGAGVTWSAHIGTRRWRDVFTGAAGSYRVRLDVSPDNNNWTSVPDWHLLAPEFTTRWIRYHVTISNAGAGSILFLRAPTIRTAYWQ